MVAGMYWTDELPHNMKVAINGSTWNDSNKLATFNEWVMRIVRAGLMTDEIRTEIAAVLLSGKNG